MERSWETRRRNILLCSGCVWLCFPLRRGVCCCVEKWEFSNLGNKPGQLFAMHFRGSGFPCKLVASGSRHSQAQLVNPKHPDLLN